MKLNNLNDKELFHLYSDLMEELRNRELIRSSNNPVSGYAEKIVADKLSLSLERGSNKGCDATDLKNGKKYQIKSRRLTKHNKSRQLGVIRNLDQNLFDYLIAVIFDQRFETQEIWQIPIEIISKYAKFSEHQNGFILQLKGKILKDGKVSQIQI